MINLKFNELREVHAKPHGVEKKCSEYIDRNILRSISNMMCTNNVQFKKRVKMYTILKVCSISSISCE